MAIDRKFTARSLGRCPISSPTSSNLTRAPLNSLAGWLTQATWKFRVVRSRTRKSLFPAQFSATEADSLSSSVRLPLPHPFSNNPLPRSPSLSLSLSLRFHHC